MRAATLRVHAHRFLGVAGALLAVALSAIAPDPAPAAPRGPGCRPQHPAVAHYAGGAALSPRPRSAPTPCGMATGYAGGESAIAVTRSGAVFYAPAVQPTAGIATQYFLGGNSGFARTTDRGASWSFVDPISTPIAGAPGYFGLDQIDDKFYVDHRTGRLFWTDPTVPGELVLWTDDDGRSWGKSVLPLGFGGEWTQVTTATRRTSALAGYPEVVYACGEYDSVGRDLSPTLEGDLCQKSLDGGQTWIATGQGLFGAPTASDPACGGQAEHPNFSPWAAPDSRGRLYELMFCAGKTFLLRSDDEAASWQVATRVPYDLPNSGPGATGAAELRTDAHDNLYLAWASAGNPNPNGPYSPGGVNFAISRDGGRHWTRATNVLAPGVEGIRTHFGFDVGAPGQVAISYLGHRGGRAGFDGYLTATSNALAKKPLFWSGVVNGGQPPLDGGGPGSSGGLGLDYVSAAIAPDGTPWASFWDACGNDLPARNPACPPDRNQPSTITYGYGDFAGRLAGFAAAATAPSQSPRFAWSPRRRCISARGVHVRLLAGAAVRSAVVFVDGRRVRTASRAQLRAGIVVRSPQRGRFTVMVRLRLPGGRALSSRRTYQRCVGAVRFTG